MRKKEQAMPIGDIKKKITEHLIKWGVVEESAEIHDKTLFGEDLGLDSLDLFDLKLSLEKEFKILIKDEGMMGVETFEELAEYIFTLIYLNRRI